MYFEFRDLAIQPLTWGPKLFDWCQNGKDESGSNVETFEAKV